MARQSASVLTLQAAKAVRQLGKCLLAPLSPDRVNKRLRLMAKLSKQILAAGPSVDSWLEQRKPDEIKRFHARMAVINHRWTLWQEAVIGRSRTTATAGLPIEYGPYVPAGAIVQQRIKSPFAGDLEFRVAIDKAAMALECWAKDAREEEKPAHGRLRANISVQFLGQRPTPQIEKLAHAIAADGKRNMNAVARKICGSKADSCLTQLRSLIRKGRVKFVGG